MNLVYFIRNHTRTRLHNRLNPEREKRTYIYRTTHIEGLKRRDDEYERIRYHIRGRKERKNKDNNG